MKTTIEVEIEPFSVPNYVRKPIEGGESIAIPLSDLPIETLISLCDQFRKDVFEKAGKVEDRFV